jgi:hypothetical protein
MKISTASARVTFGHKGILYRIGVPSLLAPVHQSGRKLPRVPSQILLGLHLPVDHRI